MRARTFRRGPWTALRSPRGNNRGSSPRQMRSVPKKMIAVTTVPDTKVMPKI